MNSIPSLSDIEEAAKRIKPHIMQTPVLESPDINTMLDAELFFKCENLQKAGAFKFRGATNSILSLPDEEARKGVATHSSGNHAQALSLAARNRGIKAYVVMPENSKQVKVNGVRKYGGEITFCEPTQKARESTLEEVVARTGATFIHPYDNPAVIAGQSTAGKELIEEHSDLDIIMAPVGGGGLLSGTALSVHHYSPNTKTYGAEPKGADDAYRSFKAGTLFPSTNPDTMADGLLTSLSTLTFTIIREYVEDILTVSEDNIEEAMRLIHKALDMVVEPSAAVPLGALMETGLDIKGRRIGIILSGGKCEP